MSDESQDFDFADPRQLRETAERIARKRHDASDSLSDKDRDVLLQELQIHQIELELQNDELRQAHNQLEFSHQQYLDLYNFAPFGYASLDDSGLIWRTNITLASMLGIEDEDIAGRALADFMLKEDRELFLGRFTAFARKPDGKHIDVRFRVQSKTRFQHFTGRIQGRRIAGVAPRYGLKLRKQQTLLITISDVTELKRNEKEIEYQAFHDALTGLPNRANLMDRLEMSLAQAHRHNRFGTLLFMDLDRFKNVNDSLGHHVGDMLLIEFADRLRETMRKEDLLVRMGGDEFVILLADQNEDKGQAALNGHRLAQHLITTLGHTLIIAGHHIKLTVSIGITTYPFQPGDTVNDIIREADTAMYQAKNRGRNQAVFFHAEMQQRANNRLTLETELRTAIEKKQFELYYQPQVDINGKLRALEALVRWNHPDRGVVEPGEFIAIMEETGLIGLLGEWVLDKACEQMQEWIEQGLLDNEATMAVNVSAKQFQTGHLSEKLKSLLRQHDLPPYRLLLEITESLLLPDDYEIQKELHHIAQLGVMLAIDDFGTGFSSLSVLQTAPISQVKVDRRFINNLDQSSQDTALVRAIISLAREMNMEVVAEGVEIEEQHTALKKLECDLLQGFLFSRPLPADEMTRLLQAQ
jgi:diguanylate cyclase (GGDEF)-like protein